MELKRFFIISTLVLGLFSITKLKAEDELVIIQATSTTGKSFLVRKGAGDGISIGQESLFSTKNASFTAVCKEVNRFFSMWTIKDKRGQVPFAKGDYVTYTNNVESIWAELPKLQLAPKEELVFKESFEWIVRGNYSYAMSESVSDTSENKTSDRLGYQLEILYANKFAIHYEWAAGVRFDRENATLTSPVLDVPTTRYMITGEFLYHFDKLRKSKNNLYAGIGFAYGLSETTVDEAISSGTTFIAPIVKVGYINHISLDYSLVFEGSIESIAQKEAFEDTTEQTTNIVSSKFSVGVRF